MSGLEQVLLPLALLTNGIAAGVMVSTAIGLAPLQSAVPYETYVDTIQFLWKRYDPFMPILNVLALLLDAVLALGPSQGSARWLFGLAALLLVTVMSISVVKNVPINRYVMSLDARAQPPDWARVDPRIRWRNWNLLRTVLAVLALLLNLTAVAVLL